MAYALRVGADGSQNYGALVQRDEGTNIARLNPVAFGSEDEKVFLVLFLTGIHHAADPNNDSNFEESVRVSLNDYIIRPTWAGKQADFAGVDQINVELPRTLTGSTNLKLSVTVVGAEPFASETNLKISALTARGSDVFAGTSDGVFVSTDEGENWIAASQGLPASTVVNALVVGGPDVFAGTANGVYRSSGNGTNWTAANQGIPANAIVKALHAYGSMLFAGTQGDGIFVATDRGATWQAINEGLTKPDVRSFANLGGRLYAGTPMGVFCAAIVNAPNTPPVALPQSFTLQQNTVLVIALTGNDQDGDQLTCSLVRLPQHGKVNFRFDSFTGLLIYTPEKDFTGTDEFTFIASDGKIGSRQARVTITFK